MLNVRLFLAAATLILSAALSAQTPHSPDCSVPFATYDDKTLELDVYLPDDSQEQHWCIIYSYGGGFVNDNQRSEQTCEFCRALAEEGYVVVASTYRLGLKGVKMKSKAGMIKPMSEAIRMASEDVFKATSYVLEHSGELKIRPDGIILCGSSAGAITSLQCDYELCNRTPISCILPEDFHYAGIISFAGAVFSREGKCDYRKHAPAPTLMFHGMTDKLVNYDRTAVFNTRFSGSNDLQKRFAKFGWSHEIIRFVDEGHGVAGRMMDNFEDVLWFIDNMVIKGSRFQIDKTVNDRDRVRGKWDSAGPETLY